MSAKHRARRVGQPAGERNLLIPWRFSHPSPAEQDLEATMFAATRRSPVQLERGLQLFRHRG
jgi:hypothetical protein